MDYLLVKLLELLIIGIIIHIKTETDKILPRLHFIVLENQYLMEALDFIRDRVKARTNDAGPVEFFATGGGSIKYAKLLREKIGVDPVKLDEIGCVVRGCNFLIRVQKQNILI